MFSEAEARASEPAPSPRFQRVRQVLVALPRHLEGSGLTEAGWWGQVLGATFVGLLNRLLVLDPIKILTLFATGPYLLLKLPEGPARAIVREGLRPIHKPLAALL